MSIHQAYEHGAVFCIQQTAGGRWCAHTVDGLVSGTFFERGAAIRFARHESGDNPLLMIDDELASSMSGERQPAAA
jgi:hypothetical protein